jgi:tetratricopeptide (TPR) repeat protein
MTPQRWQRVKELFSAASELDAAAATAYLDTTCSDDAELRAEVESLLDAHGADEAILDHPAAAHVSRDFVGAGEERWLGRRIGPYEIAALIGHGGMGDVFRARRVDAEFEKEVAIKLVPGGFHAAHVIQRFRAERQILASLDHPNIARLIDGGVTGDGAPYLVMELVEGEPLDRFAAERGLGLRDRLALFLAVCAAVSYAHQRLVVHRDLKPGNILVTAAGDVKLLDFGIAKLLQPPGAETTAAPTVTLMRTLTPGYSSPEQILGRTITTASDVYSLGVVLYVLLTGRSPYRSILDTAEDAIREVCNTEPQRPSDVAAQMAAPGREPLGRDLDAIILQALRKEPERRYASVDQFAEDIRRYLDGHPVAARGDDFSYRAGKFIRRRRVEVAAAAMLVVTLVGATIFSVREARVADEQRARAERHFASVRGLANTFMFDVNDAIEDLPGATRAREVLVSTALKYLDALAQEAGTDTDLKLELAAAFEKVGNIQGQAYGASKGDAVAAIDSYSRAIALLAGAVAAEPENARASRALARVSMMQSRLLLLQGKIQEAVAGSGRAVDLLERHFQAQPDAEIRKELAVALTADGLNRFYAGTQRDERLARLRRGVALLEDLAREVPEDLELAADLSRAYSTLASTLPGKAADRAVNDESLALYQKALAIDERLIAVTGGQNVEYLRRAFVDRGNLAIHHYETGEFRVALETIRAGKAALEKRASDPGDMQVRLDAALAAWHEGRFLFALGEAREAEDILTNNIETIDELAFEKDNLQMAFVRGASETILGKIETGRAAQPEIESAARLRHWNAARGWFQQAIPRFDRVTAVATLDYMDMRSVNDAREGLARSKAEIAKLGAASPAG